MVLIERVLCTSRNTEMRSNVCQRLLSSSNIMARVNFLSRPSLRRTSRVSWGISSSSQLDQALELITSFVFEMSANFSFKHSLVVISNSPTSSNLIGKFSIKRTTNKVDSSPAKIKKQHGSSTMFYC